MSKFDAQKIRVLNRLKQGPLTQLEAFTVLGIGRLGARVFDLREEGYQISTATIEVPNRFGDVCRVAQYMLIREPQL